MPTIRTKYELRNDTSANWTSRNPTLREGEPGIEMDTRKWKVGNGVDAWNDLDYMLDETGGGGGSTAWADLTGVPAAVTALTGTNTGDQDLSTYALTATVNAALADKYDASNPAGYITTADLSGYATTAAVAAGYQPLDAVLTGTTASFTTALETKLNGIATGATANSSDAFLLARGNHTGTQLAATISDFNAAADARVSAGLVGYITSAAVAAGYQPLDSDLTTIAGLTATTDNFIVSVASAWASRTPAQVRTTLNVANGATANDTDANLRNRATHTGTQTAATISDFSEAVDDRVGALLVAGTNMTVTYNDAAGTITLDAATGGSGDNQTAVNGTVSLPSFAFTSDPDTGMYRYGANELGFALGGALALRLGGWGASFQAAASTPCDFFVTSGTGAYTGSLSFSRNGGADTVATVESDADATTRRGLIYKAFTTDGKHRFQVNGTDRLEANNTGVVVTGTLSSTGVFTASNIPASGGGTTNYLRADGTWNAPPGTGGAAAEPGFIGVKGTTAGAPGTGAFTPNAAATNSRAWSTVGAGWWGIVRFQDGTDWALAYSYWNGTTLSRSANQLIASSTGSVLNLTASATAEMLCHGNAYSSVLNSRDMSQSRGWTGIVGATTVPTAVGTAAPTVTGTAQSAAIGTGSYVARRIRSRTASATTANAQAGYTSTVAQLVTSSTAERGGWSFHTVFGVETIPVGPRIFIGMTASTFVGITLEPSAFTGGAIAVLGKDSTDTNLQIMLRDQAALGTTTKTDTGIALVSGSAYYFDIWSEPSSLRVYYLLVRLDTGAIFYGSSTTTVPLTGTTMFPQILGGLSGTTGTAIQLCLSHAYWQA